ncbi:sugar isomerase domain-containing protein [Algoriphagus kandeliae]|uniref:Sugar isomerase domain-containing protein n=1 Tax=Algoriphagus kandeliae TaxID=2562278 RepID=A0A4Y9QSR9_9BACT|nr:SIS domain-containing protein [Algoriphagus kandeliae]TFV94173.1 sugar isomerase domain-containing protein [Algoriphagus kandeliae]
MSQEKAFLRYQHTIEKKLQQAFSQTETIDKAAGWVADSIQNLGWIFTSGTGHSHLLAEEIFYRAGGFTRVKPILDPPLMLHISASESSHIERQEGYATHLLSNYQIGEKDLFFLFSNSGRNAVPIELAMEAKNRGARVICITNLTHSQSVDSRHSSNLRLFEVADLVLDNFGEIGDASIDIQGLKGKVGATSTVIGAALLHAILCQAVEILIDRGVDPEVFISANTEEGEAANERLIEKYKGEVPPL